MTIGDTLTTDVVIIGAGNAALCAALAAREHGAQVVVLEAAPEDERGGNSRYTAGAIRFAHKGIEDLRQILPDLTQDEIDKADFGIYSREDFFDDMAACDPLSVGPRSRGNASQFEPGHRPMDA